MGRRLGVGKNHVYQLEAGSRTPSDSLLRLLEAIELSPVETMSEEAPSSAVEPWAEKVAEVLTEQIGERAIGELAISLSEMRHYPEAVKLGRALFENFGRRRFGTPESGHQQHQQ